MKKLKVWIYTIIWSTLAILGDAIIVSFFVRSKLLFILSLVLLIPWTFGSLLLTWLYSYLKNKNEGQI